MTQLNCLVLLLAQMKSAGCSLANLGSKLEILIYFKITVLFIAHKFWLVGSSLLGLWLWFVWFVLHLSQFSYQAGWRRYGINGDSISKGSLRCQLASLAFVSSQLFELPLTFSPTFTCYRGTSFLSVVDSRELASLVDSWLGNTLRCLLSIELSFLENFWALSPDYFLHS